MSVMLQDNHGPSFLRLLYDLAICNFSHVIGIGCDYTAYIVK